jgi:hypothetical protein
MFAVFDPVRASETILHNLTGLLTNAEIEDHRGLLLPETV